MSIDHDVRDGLRAGLDRDPDAGLVAALDDVEPATLTGEDLAAYVRARWQVHNRATAQLLEAMHHLGRAEEDRVERRATIDEFSGDEVAALLGWSRTMASRRLGLADDLVDRLPELGDALHAGGIDEPKVRAFSELTGDITDDLAHRVCAEVLPEAAELPVGALRERIEKVVLALDPDWAERRRKRAESRARVILSPNPSGTATLSFCDAPAPDGVASGARVEALAAAVRHLGVLTPINVLRLQVGMRLLDGSTAGMDDRAVALLLATEYHAENTPSETADTPDDPDDERPDDGPDDAGPDDAGPDDEPDGGPDDGGPDDGPDDGGPDDGPDDSRPDGGPGDPGATPPEPHPLVPAPLQSAYRALRSLSEQGLLDLPDLPDAGSDAELLDVPERRAGRVRTGTVEVRLRLTTALGLDHLPGSVPGFGAVLAHDAREMIRRRPDGEWRVVLTDSDGRLEHVLLARRRPRPPDRSPGPRDRKRARGRRSRAHAMIVELQVPTALLAALAPDEHGAWAPLLAELQQRHLELLATGRFGRPPDADAAPDVLARRRAGAELERWTRVRDRYCVAPWCRRPAHKAEIDHTLDHALGGPSAYGNLGAWCSHDHRAKHHAGWKVRQPVPGWFVIRTRAGVTHTTRPKRVLEPLPSPGPAVRPRPLPADGWNDSEQPSAGDPEHYPEDDGLVTGLRYFSAGLGRPPTPGPSKPAPCKDYGEPPF